MADQEEKQPEQTDAGQAKDEQTEEIAVEASEPEALVGIGIVIIGYTQEKAADATLKEMKQAKKQGTFYYEDAAVIRQDAKGKVHINETEDMSTGKGAGIGAVVGGLIGLLGGPGGAVLGAGVGAGVGGALAHHDAGFRNEGLKDVGSALRPGTSALVVTTNKHFVEQMRKEVPAADLADASRHIAQEISDSLAAGKDMALGMLFTEKGIAVKEVRVNDETAEIYGLVVTEEGVAAVAAVATDEGIVYEAGIATDEGSAYEVGVITPEGAIIADAAETDEDVVEGVAVIVPDEDVDSDSDTPADAAPESSKEDGEKKGKQA